MNITNSVTPNKFDSLTLKEEREDLDPRSDIENKVELAR